MTLDEWEAEADRIEDEVNDAIEASAERLSQLGDSERAAAVLRAHSTAAAPGLAVQEVLGLLENATDPELVKPA